MSELKYLHGDYGQMFHYELKLACGLAPKKDWPDAGLPETVIGNVTVYVKPKGQGKNGQGRRTFAICPECQKHVCAGHLHQHLTVHGLSKISTGKKRKT